MHRRTRILFTTLSVLSYDAKDFSYEVCQYLFDMINSADQEFLNREEWRTWLEINHSSEEEIWVIIQKKKSKRKGLKYQEAIEEAICFGWIDSKMQSIDDLRFRLRFSPRRKNSIWSRNNKETAEKMMHIGRMTEAGLQTINEAKSNGKWETAYSSKMVPKIPEDLAKAFEENDLAKKNFSEFSNSAKFQYIYWINNAKRDETRRKRINEVVNRSKQRIAPG